MKTMLNNNIFLTVCRVVPAVFFIFAGAEKIGDPAGFAVSIANYNLFANSIIILTAISIPWIELITGILLLFGKYKKENAFIILILILIFTVLVGISMMRGLNIECGCLGGIAAQKIGTIKVIENIFLAFLSYLVIIGREDEVEIEIKE